MKKKINIQLFCVSTFSIILTMFLIVGIFYEVFLVQVKQEVKSYTNLLVDIHFFDDLENAKNIPWNKELRITLVRQDGIVLYDTNLQENEMENHALRPEILEAIESGQGTDIRTSKSLGSNTFYYAKQMENGNILRVAKDTYSIWSILSSVFPTLLFFAVLLFILSFIVSRSMTKSLIRPIENLADNIANPDESGIYEELQPFITTIQNQHEDIVKSSMIRQEFTANVSHELKTPLTAISGYAELIENGMASSDDVIRFAKGIHKSSNRLLSLINDIIRLSELDADRCEDVSENINLYNLAQICVDMLQMNAEKHKVELNFEGKDTIIFANRQMIEEVLYNLVDNAIRYNKEKGKVFVRVKEEDGRGVLIVEDTGIGISKENQERVFERFYRVDKSRSKSTGGTGLGLAIVKHIIKKQNAKLELESKEGVGTKITILFPSKKGT